LSFPFWPFPLNCFFLCHPVTPHFNSGACLQLLTLSRCTTKGREGETTPKMPPKRKRYRTVDACLTRAENKKINARSQRLNEISLWHDLLRSSHCESCDRNPFVGHVLQVARIGCSCVSNWNSRWVWIYDLNGAITMTRMIFCMSACAIMVEPIAVTPGFISLEVLGHRMERGDFTKGMRCEVDGSLIELTLWTRQMEKGNALHASLFELLKRFLLEAGVCDFVFSFLRFPSLEQK
jgi:hypothetical protein